MTAAVFPQNLIYSNRWLTSGHSLQTDLGFKKQTVSLFPVENFWGSSLIYVIIILRTFTYFIWSVCAHSTCSESINDLEVERIQVWAQEDTGSWSQLCRGRWQGTGLQLPRFACLPWTAKAAPAPKCLSCSISQTTHLPFSRTSLLQGTVKYLKQLLVFGRILLHQPPDLVVVVVRYGLFHSHSAGHGALLPQQGGSCAWKCQIQTVKPGTDTTGDGDQVRSRSVTLAPRALGLENSLLWGDVLNTGGCLTSLAPTH